MAKFEAESPEHHAAHDAARFRLAWALAHSKRSGDGTRAVELLREEGYAWGDTVQARDRRYITAVAQYNEGDYLAARTSAEDALRLDAGCRQAEALRVAAEDAIARMVSLASAPWAWALQCWAASSPPSPPRSEDDEKDATRVSVARTRR